MTIRDNTHEVQDVVPIRHVLASNYDKSELGNLVEGVIDKFPDAIFYSTGGTAVIIKETLGDRADANYISVEDLTGIPEMDGGLVKTLTHAIHAGLLSEASNPKHEEYLKSLRAVPFDVMVGNLYPFAQVIEDGNVSFEKARGYWDIGGPTMAAASAKNFPRVAILTSPLQYDGFLQTVSEEGGTTLRQRFRLMKDAAHTLAVYYANIDQFWNDTNEDAVMKSLLSADGGVKV